MWVIASAILTMGTALSAVFAAIVLDVLIYRPENGGSVTTLIPGSVYASATAMKVCLASGVMSAVTALVSRAAAGRKGVSGEPHRLPVCGIASLCLAASTPLIGALAVIAAQAFAGEPAGLPVNAFSNISRLAVFAKMAIISAGVLSAATSIVRRERPRLLPWLGLATNGLLIGLFWYFQFFALGFDQDTWAPQ